MLEIFAKCVKKPLKKYIAFIQQYDIIGLVISERDQDMRRKRG